MILWGLLPLPAAAAFLAVAVAAGVRRGAPRGRTALVLVGVTGFSLLGSLAGILSGGISALNPLILAGANVAWLVSLPAWIALALRFGAARGQSGGWTLLVPLACLADVGLALAGAFGAESVRIEVDSAQAPLYLAGAASRAAAGVFLVLGAFGLMRAQACWEVARHERLKQLRRAYAGLILAFLTIFLFAAQTLLYGAASLKILALGSLVFIPAFAVIVPLLRAPAAESAVLPASAQPIVSSGVLVGLGGFLILLALVGEVVSRFAPAGRVLWFQWGGSILVGFYGALWLVPGTRRRLRQWMFVPGLGRTYQWEPWPLLESTRPASGGPALLLLSGLFEEPKGRPAVALWVRTASGGYAPWVESSSLQPCFDPGNPLLDALQRERGLLDLTRPPGRLALVPAYAENLELIERMGFRLFLSLCSGQEAFGILALAPRDPASGAEDALLLDLYRGELGVLAWGTVVAWGDAGAKPGEAPVRHFGEASHLMQSAAAEAGVRRVAPRFGGRIAVALEEVARLLETRAQRSAAIPPPSSPDTARNAGPVAGGARG